tara:strand:- start:250 stop:1359 length:1110 start_codon:yes stop_codon:yes gene_type:complete
MLNMRQHKGFSVLELSLALLITVLLSLMASQFYHKIKQATIDTKTVELHKQIQQAIFLIHTQAQLYGQTQREGHLSQFTYRKKDGTLSCPKNSTQNCESLTFGYPRANINVFERLMEWPNSVVFIHRAPDKTTHTKSEKSNSKLKNTYHSSNPSIQSALYNCSKLLQPGQLAISFANRWILYDTKDLKRDSKSKPTLQIQDPNSCPAEQQRNKKALKEKATLEKVRPQLEKLGQILKNIAQNKNRNFKPPTLQALRDVKHDNQELWEKMRRFGSTNLSSVLGECLTVGNNFTLTNRGKRVKLQTASGKLTYNIDDLADRGQKKLLKRLLEDCTLPPSENQNTQASDNKNKNDQNLNTWLQRQRQIVPQG